MKEMLSAAVSRRKTPLLFVASSLALSAADFIVSNLVYYVLLPGNKFISVPAGRLTGALVGFILNRTIVFKGKKGHWSVETWTFVKYAIVWLLNNFLAVWLINLLQTNFAIEYWLAWIICSLLLYVPNYLLQRYVVFRKKPGGAAGDPASAPEKQG